MAPTNHIKPKRIEEKMGEKVGKDGQLKLVWKASLKSNVFNCFLNVNKEGPGRSSSRSWFHKVGVTVKKALPLVEDLWASVGVAILRNLD